MLDEDEIRGFLYGDESSTDQGEWFEFQDDDDDYDDYDEGDTIPSARQGRTGPVKLKRKRLKRPDYIPRVVKHDIRRFYSRMLVNIANQHDLSLHKSFMETFAYRPTLSFVFEDLAPPSSLHRPEGTSLSSLPIARFALHGIDELLCFEAVNHQLSPDAVTHIVHSSVHTRSDTNNSEVRSIFRIDLSMLYAVNSRALVHDMMGAMGFRDGSTSSSAQGTGTSLWPAASVSASTSSWSETSTDVMRVYQEHQPLASLHVPNIFELYRLKHGQAMPQFPTPRQLTVEIALTMKLNERRQIETIVFRKPHVFRCHTTNTATDTTTPAAATTTATNTSCSSVGRKRGLRCRALCMSRDRPWPCQAK